MLNASAMLQRTPKGFVAHCYNGLTDGKRNTFAKVFETNDGRDVFALDVVNTLLGNIPLLLLKDLVAACEKQNVECLELNAARGLLELAKEKTHRLTNAMREE